MKLILIFGLLVMGTTTLVMADSHEANSFDGAPEITAAGSSQSPSGNSVGAVGTAGGASSSSSSPKSQPRPDIVDKCAGCTGSSVD